MMLKLLLILFITLLIQACQVSEKVSNSNQVAPSNFPGATLTTVLAQDGWKKLGDNINITLLYPLPITVSGLPYIEAQIGSYKRRFYYTSGSGTGQLVFSYSVSAVDLDLDGIVFEKSIQLNAGGLTYSPSPTLTENVPTSLTIPTSLIKVDGIVPTRTLSLAPTGGLYSTGQLLKYHLTYSEKVFVNGAPSFNIMNLTSGTVPAIYRSGSGTTVLQFARLLQVGDADINGFTTSNSLNLSSGITISDQAGNSVLSSMPPIPSANILINVAQPIITGVSLPADNTYVMGNTLDFTLTFNEDVKITGTPAIPIVLSTGTVLAHYVSGSESDTILFRYTVQTNNVDIDGILLQSPLLLNGGTITNMAANQNAALIYTVPTTSNNIFIDAATGPYVISASIPSSTPPLPALIAYRENQNLDFTLTFNSNVFISNPIAGYPRLPIIVGNTTVYATFQTSTANSLVFRYTPTTSHQDMDGISLLGPIDLGPTSLKDAANKDAILAFTPPNTTSLLVDGTSPTITSITPAAVSGTMVEGQNLDLFVEFSEVVSVSGNPVISIEVGSTLRNALFVSGSGTKTLKFRYPISSTDLDTDGVEFMALQLPIAGTDKIQDLRLHDASLTFASFPMLSITVDAADPGFSSFTLPVVPPAGVFKNGKHLDFKVKWLENVYVTGSPRLALAIDAIEDGLPYSAVRYATYISGSGTDELTFRYTTQTGDLDTDGITTTGFQLDTSFPTRPFGGLIRDVSGNDATLLLTIPSLAALQIDAIDPYVTSVTVPATPVYYGVGQTINLTVTWQEPIFITGGNPSLRLTVGSTDVDAIVTPQGPTTTATFSYTVLAGQLDNNGLTMLSAIFLSSGVAIKDLAGNNSYLQIEPPSLSGIKVDGIVPTIIGVTPPASKIYKYRENIDFTVVWSEPVTVSGSPRIGIRIGSDQYYATHYSTTSNTSIFRYTVGNGSVAHTLDESDDNGITITTNNTDGLGNIINSYIALNSGSIVDVANNPAVLTFTAPALTGVKVDGITAIVDPTNPISTGMVSGTYCLSFTYCPDIALIFTVNWTKNVNITGSPSIQVNVGGSNKTATYLSGDGSKNIFFRYNLLAGDIDTDGISVAAQSVAGGTVKYEYTPILQPTVEIDADRNFVPSTAFNISMWGITVDCVSPTASSITSINVSNPSKNNIFKAGEWIEYQVTFNEPVVAINNPTINIVIGAQAAVANFVGGSGTNTLRFRYQIPAGSTLLDLDGITVNPTMNLSTIPLHRVRDLYGNYYAGAMPAFSETDVVYFANIIARFKPSGSGYTNATCSVGTSDCVTSLIDITLNGNTLVPAPGMDGPEIKTSGFGATSNRPYLQFNNASLLKTTTALNVRSVIFVIQTVSDASTSIAISNHSLLKRYNTGPGTYSTAIEFTSTSFNKEVIFNPAQRFAWWKPASSVSSFPTYLNSDIDPILWTASTDYLMLFELNAQTTFDIGSTIGGSDFNGKIAEIIFMDNSSGDLTAGQATLLHDQLAPYYDLD